MTVILLSWPRSGSSRKLSSISSGHASVHFCLSLLDVHSSSSSATSSAAMILGSVSSLPRDRPLRAVLRDLPLPALRPMLRDLPVSIASRSSSSSCACLMILSMFLCVSTKVSSLYSGGPVTSDCHHGKTQCPSEFFLQYP